MSGMDSGAPRIQFSDTETTTTGDDRSLSRSALLALFGALFSWLALANPVFLAVPGLTVLISGLALWQIASHPDTLSGRRVALASLAIGLVFLSWAPTRHFTREQRLFREATPLGKQWLETIAAGKFMEALQFKMPQSERIAPDASLERFYEQQGNQASLRDFMRDTDVSFLHSLGTKARISHVANLYTEAESATSDAVHLQYRIDYDSSGKPQHRLVTLVLIREMFSITRESQWRVYSMTMTPASS